jgi:hypothetical protein
MPYIGRGISQLQTIDKLDAITPSTSTGAGPYNLTQSSSAFTPISANNLLISINGVVQYGNFTVSGSTVTFTGALSDSDTCNFILHVGEGVVNTPGAGTVTGSSVASSFDISSKTVTLPASVSGLGTGITNAQLAGSIANAKLANSQITINGSAVSLGGSTTIATGIEWQSTIVTGATLSATANYGYFIDTSSNACTVTLPGSASVGDELWFVDYARNFSNNNLTINPNSLKYQGATSPNPVYNTNGQAIHIIYSGTTKGWIPITDDDVTYETPQPYTIQYLVIAGGGAGGGGHRAGGGGAGGYRNSYASETSGRNSSTETPYTVNPGTVVTVTVGAGGAVADSAAGNQGGSSSIAASGQTTITSYGGGGGGDYETSAPSGTYGSGAGAGHNGTGNTSGSNGTAGQGFDGGDAVGSSYQQGGAGGGAGANGPDGGTNVDTTAGTGLSSSITGSAVTRAGGGGAGGYSSGGYGNGGAGGGGNGGSTDASDPHSGVVASGSYYHPTSGTDGTGGGGGGTAHSNNTTTYGRGGSGIVILRVPTASYTGTTTGSPTVTTSGSDTIMQFTGSGSYTT